MARLDVRAKTEFAAKVCSTSNSREQRRKVVVKELSLSGALIEGLSTCGECFSIKPELPHGREIELSGEVVRVENGNACLRLDCQDLSTMEILWKNIKEAITELGVCPYCGLNSLPAAMNCEDCGMSLQFDEEGYLKEHFKRTFPVRISNRLEKLDAGCLNKILKIIDKEILRFTGEPAEDEFVGTSPAMLELFSTIRKVAPTEVNVLILGESGTGKELTAKAIHERSHRKNEPFVAINSAAIPDGLLEAELFGYEKGAFTGACAARRGKFEQADGGTIFLDEVGDLSVGLQAKLLRFIEDRIVERIGGKSGKKVDVRVVTATNGDLKGMVSNGLFREDLYYRLDGFTIQLPPLRNRGEDKIILANYIANRISRAEGAARKGFSREAIEAIDHYSWPGNVRELINKVRRGALMATGSEIGPADMGLDHTLLESRPGTMKRKVATAHESVVKQALQNNDYVISRAANDLGISRPSLYALMKKYDLRKSNNATKATC